MLCLAIIVVYANIWRSTCNIKHVCCVVAHTFWSSVDCRANTLFAHAHKDIHRHAHTIVINCKQYRLLYLCCRQCTCMPQPFQHGLDKAHDAVHRVYYGYVGKLNPVTQENRKICELCLNPTFSYVTLINKSSISCGGSEQDRLHWQPHDRVGNSNGAVIMRHPAGYQLNLTFSAFLQCKWRFMC